MRRIERHHWIGLLVGALLGAGVAELGRVLGYAFTLSDGLFWGCVIGGVMSGVPQFAQSGAVLTRRENRALNTLVGIVGSLVFVSVFVALILMLVGLFF